MGFYTTVHVRARSIQEAELRAVNALRRDKSLHASLRNSRSDPPRMFVDEIAELASFKGCRVPRTGFAFYADGALDPDNDSGGFNPGEEGADRVVGRFGCVDHRKVCGACNDGQFRSRRHGRVLFRSFRPALIKLSAMKQNR